MEFNSNEFFFCQAIEALAERRAWQPYNFAALLGSFSSHAQTNSSWSRYLPNRQKVIRNVDDDRARLETELIALALE